ncbi:hypothetical protein R1flu_025327 [Riccia fluitans]|uniref:DUF1475 domain-containing protein n=1 Tax=Riccia fluitans TaxID=41844 RepID=A0ABD1XXF4_9MARC
MATPVLVGRALCTALGLAQFCVVGYTLVTDGSPFRKELLIPWMNATLIDFYISMSLYIAWVWYKEPAWIRRLVWTVLVICTGSVATSWYLAIEFFKLSLDDPPHLVLLRDRHARWLSTNLLDSADFGVSEDGTR